VIFKQILITHKYQNIQICQISQQTHREQRPEAQVGKEKDSDKNQIRKRKKDTIYELYIFPEENIWILHNNYEISVLNEKLFPGLVK
jgi:hypothetical protein